MARPPRQHASSSNQGTRMPPRTRASPSRLVKLYDKMTKPQRDKIKDLGFGGLLNIKSETLPARLSNWLMTECYDAETSELVLPGRGAIKVTPEAVQDVFDLPNEGDEVKYELNVDAINFIQAKYKIARSKAPRISAVVKRVEKNKTANDDFARSWLMLAISTFLCPPTSMGISPRCYPSIIDLSHVKKLNWCQFVVDQLKKAGSKLGKRSSVKGCVFFLVIIYVDSLLVDNVEIPTNMPRAAAWSRSLIDQVVKLDTNRDGSFGKLKLKRSSHTVINSSLFHLDDVQRFVSSKVASNMSNQKKRKLTDAVTQFCAGFTNLMGTFLEKVSEIEEPSPTSSDHGNERQPARAPKRRTRSTRDAFDDAQLPDDEEVEDDFADEEDEDDGTEEDAKDDSADEEDEDHGTEEAAEDDCADEEDEDDGTEEEAEDVPTDLEDYGDGTDEEGGDEGSDDDEHAAEGLDGIYTGNTSEDEQHDDLPAEQLPLSFILPKNVKQVGNAHLRKLKLRLPCDPVEGKDAGAAAFASTSVPNHGEVCSFKVSDNNSEARSPIVDTCPDFKDAHMDDATIVEKQSDVQAAVGDASFASTSTHDAGEGCSFKVPVISEVGPPVVDARPDFGVADADDATRGHKQCSAQAAADLQTLAESEDYDIEDLVPLKVRLERLRSLKHEDKRPDTSTSFEAAPLEVIAPEHNPKSSSHPMRDCTSSCPLNFTPPEINIMKFVDSQGGCSSSACTPPAATCQDETSLIGSLSSWSDVPEEVLAQMENDAIVEIDKRKATMKAAAGPEAKVLFGSVTSPNPVPLPSTSKELPSGNSSVTPTYQPHPNRIRRRPATMRSPYVDFDTKKNLKCSKAVCATYNAICAHGNSRSTRSKEAEELVIINYWSYYVTLHELASSVKPGGKLLNSVAEIGIHAIDNTKRKATKRVLPLRVSTYILRGDLTSTVISQVFWPSENHLDHRHMVMFPVLQVLGDGNSTEQVGHYFLLVLNLRDNRFEVLDSMRSLSDKSLQNCCNTLMDGIKKLWIKYKYEAKVPICNYELVDIGVPIQSNNHDCGFHMLMHAEHWDGRSIQHFKESDIPNIRKLLLHKWITHEENVTKDWLDKLHSLDNDQKVQKKT